MGVFGAPHHLFFCNSFVQNKVTEIVALVLGGLEYKMTFLLQGIRGGGRSHPVYSDIHVVESPHHKLAILGLKGIKWGRGRGGGGGSRIWTRVCLVLEPMGAQARGPSPALLGGMQAGRSARVTTPHRFTNGSGSDLKGWRELSFPFHIKRKKKREGGNNRKENCVLISIVWAFYSASLTSLQGWLCFSS